MGNKYCCSAKNGPHISESNEQIIMQLKQIERAFDENDIDNIIKI